MRVRTLSVFLILTLLLSGCAAKITPESLLQEKKEQLLAAGNSVDFTDGYADGCAAGRQFMGDHNYQANKDETRYSMQQEYNVGWERGYYFCRDEAIAKLQQESKQEYIPTKNAAEEKERQQIWEDVRK